MSRFPVTFLVLAVAVVGAIGGWLLFWPSESHRYAAVTAVSRQSSWLRAQERITYARGPIASETTTLVDADGRSRATYAVADRKGTIATFTEPLAGYDVSFAFQKLVADGAWELRTPRVFHGSTAVAYAVTIAQRIGPRGGTHRFAFADPHWLATAAGNQYEIHLDRGKPVPSEAELLRLRSTSNADPRYQQVVDDFAAFGPPSFKKTVAIARAKVLRSGG